ncbi:transposase [Microbacterium telephonicum]|uniref:Transposase-like protein n=1 Tax=Microbacterium telephonicum TaxID=1714841 RepID=A0A498C304_9MICO|nr:transposase [Microbacterium telephonicum]RLK49399.1 transposase-like protein [Microbacterium telephonicum]
MPIKFTDEFKRDAVSLVESGIAQKAACKDLGVSKSALQAWVRDAKFQPHGLTGLDFQLGRLDLLEWQQLQDLTRRDREELKLRSRRGHLIFCPRPDLGPGIPLPGFDPSWQT